MLWKRLRDTTHPSFTLNLLSRTLWEVSIILFGTASSIIIARCLGPYGKGVINTLQQFLGFAGSLAVPGLYPALQYHIAAGKCDVKEGVANYVFFTLVYSCPFTFVLLLLSPFFTHNILKGVPIAILLISLLIFFVSAFFSPLSITLSALQRFPQLAFCGLLSLTAKLFLLFFFLVILKMDLWGAFLPDWLLLPLGTYLGFYFLSDVLTLSSFKPRFNKALLKSLLSYGLKVFTAGILGLTTLRVDVFFVNSFLSPTAVGLYMTGVSYTELIRFIPSAVSTVLFPRVAASGEAQAKELATFITRSFPLYLFPVSAILFLSAPLIIPLLYGAKFIPSIRVVSFLLPGIFFWCYSAQLGDYLAGRGYPEFTLYSISIATLITLVGDFLLIPVMGINGAAFVSSLAYFSHFLLLLYFFRLNTGSTLSEILLTKKDDVLYLWKILKEKGVKLEKLFK
ncbi:MAG: oligosaccharide flippase family protein [bacterium]